MQETIANAITVDVESWCHASTENFADLPAAEQRDGVMRGLDIVLNLLDRRKIHGTFFVLGSVAEAVPEAIETLRSGGHEIGSHGYEHNSVASLTPESFAADLRRSRKILGDVTLYRAPMWSLYSARSWALEVLVQEGFRFDSSLFPIPHVGSSSLPTHPYDIQTDSGRITEIPPLSDRGLWTRYPLGGTWGLRTFFYSDIQRAVRGANRNGGPAVFHIHPWEVDPQRPNLQQPFWTKLALTIRLTDLKKRIDRLLSEFSFAPLSQTLNGASRPTLRVEDLP